MSEEFGCFPERSSQYPSMTHSRPDPFHNEFWHYMIQDEMETAGRITGMPVSRIADDVRSLFQEDPNRAFSDLMSSPSSIVWDAIFTQEIYKRGMPAQPIGEPGTLGAEAGAAAGDKVKTGDMISREGDQVVVHMPNGDSMNVSSRGTTIVDSDGQPITAKRVTSNVPGTGQYELSNGATLTTGGDFWDSGDRIEYPNGDSIHLSRVMGDNSKLVLSIKRGEQEIKMDVDAQARVHLPGQ